MVLFNLKNPIIILGLLTCISFTSNCNMITDNWISFYQLSIYGGICSLVTLIALVALIAYKMTKALEADTYIFEDYKLGKKSPRTLKKIN